MKRNQAKPKRRQPKVSARSADYEMIGMIDALREFEEFRETLLPALRADIKAGMTPQAMRDKWKSIIQARLIQTAITSPDVQAMAAAKDILDRADGRPTEKKEVTHRYAEMKDEELDAILASEEEDLRHLLEHTSSEH